jgi:putative hydrolase of the HAD superfamily
MNKPKMILFDYGGTLMYEPDFEPANGNKAIYPYISENPHNVSLEEFSEYLLRFFEEIRELRGEYIEIHEHIFLRNVLEHFEMELSVSIEEAEWIIWNGISKGVPTPGAAEMLSELRQAGIRTGVISNLCWSGAALTRRLTETFPEHKFDFIMTSSEYIFRKPDRHIFDMAMRKSGLDKSDIWYCGNDIEVDIVGAHKTGIYPAFYDDRNVPSKIHEKNDQAYTDFSYLRIGCWRELIDKMK